MTKKKDPNLTKHEALVLAWKNRADYKGYDRSKGSSFNSWRSIVNTKRGQHAGFPESWRNYDVFMSEVQGEWEHGKIAVRLDPKQPHSKENTVWAVKGVETLSKLIKLEYKGVTKTLLEWSRELKVNYNGLRQRYFRHKDWSKEEILFGKQIKRRVINENPYKHRIIRMCGAYKLRDKKKGLVSDITTEFMLELCKHPCIYCGDTKNIGLDRIDNSKGHTKDNVVPCCYECNCARMDNFTHEEMMILGEVIKKIKKNRKDS